VEKKDANTLSIFGRNLARLRNVAALTQERLAEKASVHPRYVQKLESGKAHPSLVVLARLKKALGCEWNDLLAKVAG
jgi:transcriptional regulator with XRE-family HTH domain